MDDVGRMYRGTVKREAVERFEAGVRLSGLESYGGRGSGQRVVMYRDGVEVRVWEGSQEMRDQYEESEGKRERRLGEFDRLVREGHSRGEQLKLNSSR